MKKSISLIISLALVFSLLAPIAAFAGGNDSEESELQYLYKKLYNSRYGKAFRSTDLITVEELFSIRNELKGKSHVSNFIDDVYEVIIKNTKLNQFLYDKYFASKDNVNELKTIVFAWEEDHKDKGNLQEIVNSFKTGDGTVPNQWNQAMGALKDEILKKFQTQIDTLKSQLKEGYKTPIGVFELSIELGKAVLDNLVATEIDATPDLKFSINKAALYKDIGVIEETYVANKDYKLTKSLTESELSNTIDSIISVAKDYYETVKPIVKEKAGISDKQLAVIISQLVGTYNHYEAPDDGHDEEPTPSPGGGAGGGGGAPAPAEPDIPEVTVPEDKTLPATVTLGEDHISVKTKDGIASVSADSKVAVKAVETLRKEAGKDREVVLNMDLSHLKEESISLEIPYELIKAIGENKVSLNIASNDMEILVPFDALEDIEIEKGYKVVLNTEDVTKSVKESVEEHQVVRKAIDLNLEIVKGDSVTQVEEFKSPITVTIEVKGLWNRDKLVAYYLNEEDNTLEFVTGKIVDGNLVLKLSHFSKYLVVESNITFSDITNHWAKLYIESMAAKNVVGGYNDGTFRPNNSVTRAEFSKMILEGLEIELVKYNGEFTDVKAGDWHADYLATMRRIGLAEGYGDGTYRPDQYITRAEIAIILSNVIDVELSEEEIDTLLNQFTDKDEIPAWAKEAIAEVVKSKVMVGDNNRFSPSDNTTRAESATTIYRIYNR